MKRILAPLLLLLITSSSSFAGEFRSSILNRPSEEDLWYFDELVAVSQANKTDLYLRVKQWALGNIQLTGLNTLYNDKDSQSLAMTASIVLQDMRADQLVNQTISFKVRVDFQDSKALITTTGFIYSGRILGSDELYLKPVEALNQNSFSPDSYLRISEAFDHQFKAFLKVLEKAIAGANILEQSVLFPVPHKS